MLDSGGFCSEPRLLAARTTSPDIAVVKQSAVKESGVISQFGTHCGIWKRLCQSDTNFRAAQEKVRNDMYHSPSQRLADALCASLYIACGQLYDVTIQHSHGTGYESPNVPIKRTNASFKTNIEGNLGRSVKII
ncbi:hypothetical protein GQ54DRAFT_310712 [Martensiomyces pterosporus]|nr:hypothetical protein GQ54DRAFT_310712 [Martensiomyces pterosporus]